MRNYMQSVYYSPIERIYPVGPHSHSMGVEQRCVSAKHGVVSFVTGMPITDPDKINVNGDCRGFEEKGGVNETDPSTTLPSM